MRRENQRMSEERQSEERSERQREETKTETTSAEAETESDVLPSHRCDRQAMGDICTNLVTASKSHVVSGGHMRWDPPGTVI